MAELKIKQMKYGFLFLLGIFILLNCQENHSTKIMDDMSELGKKNPKDHGTENPLQDDLNDVIKEVWDWELGSPTFGEMTSYEEDQIYNDVDIDEVRRSDQTFEIDVLGTYPATAEFVLTVVRDGDWTNTGQYYIFTFDPLSYPLMGIAYATGSGGYGYNEGSTCSVAGNLITMTINSATLDITDNSEYFVFTTYFDSVSNSTYLDYAPSSFYGFEAGGQDNGGGGGNGIFNNSVDLSGEAGASVLGLLGATFLTIALFSMMMVNTFNPMVEEIDMSPKVQDKVEKWRKAIEDTDGNSSSDPETSNNFNSQESNNSGNSPGNSQDGGKNTNSDSSMNSVNQNINQLISSQPQFISPEMIENIKTISNSVKQSWDNMPEAMQEQIKTRTKALYFACNSSAFYNDIAAKWVEARQTKRDGDLEKAYLNLSDTLERLGQSSKFSYAKQEIQTNLDQLEHAINSIQINGLIEQQKMHNKIAQEKINDLTDEVKSEITNKSKEIVKSIEAFQKFQQTTSEVSKMNPNTPISSGEVSGELNHDAIPNIDLNCKQQLQLAIKGVQKLKSMVNDRQFGRFAADILEARQLIQQGDRKMAKTLLTGVHQSAKGSDFKAIRAEVLETAQTFGIDLGVDSNEK